MTAGAEGRAFPDGAPSGMARIFIDGACSGNPGPAGIGYLIQRGDAVLEEGSSGIGEATNNIAEYTALIRALEAAVRHGIREAVVSTDSELLYRQVRGIYKVRNEGIRPLYEEARRLAAGFRRLEIRHVPREQNARADALAKKAVQGERTRMAASKRSFGEESPSSSG